MTEVVAETSGPAKRCSYSRSQEPDRISAAQDIPRLISTS